MIGSFTSYFDRGLNRRVLVGPNGGLIPTPNSLTHGINEGISRAVSDGWAFRCLPHEQVQCDDGIVIPACAHADIDLGTTEFYIKPGVANPGFVMSSFNGGRFNHCGVLIYAGSNQNAAMYIAPHTPDPKYGQKIIQHADISFGWVNCQSAVDAIVQIDLGDGMIYNNRRIEWQALQGWNGVENKANHGLIVLNPGPGHAMNMNFFRIGQLFGFSDTGVRIGNSDSNAIFMSDNTWEVNLNITNVNATSAVTTWGSFDEFNLGATIYTGSLQYPIIYRPGSQNNRHLIRQGTAQFAVSDSGVPGTNRAI